MKLKDIKIAYFLGIGGIGMSAVARYFMETGVKVYGYDKTRNDLTIQLESEGFEIHYHEDISLIPEEVKGKNGIVIYTPAIPKTNTEFLYFIDQQVKIYKRSQVLGMISEGSYTIAVGGTHGKTTTSCMIAHMLFECNINFTAFLGGISNNFNSNYYHKTDGKSLFPNQIMVVEADEFDRSFLHLKPDVCIVTSTDADHLDIYGAPSEVKKSFQDFVNCLREGGTAIINDKLDLQSEENLILYGSRTSSEAFYDEIGIESHRFCFDFNFMKENYRVISGLPGFHNVENTTAALVAGITIGLDAKELIKAASDFKGVKRRFEYVVNTKSHVVIDDYAHHPTELTACINSVKELYPDKKITGIFQPHLFSRTRDFADGFAEALDQLDECWLMDIYPARELPIEGINSEFLALRMKKNALLISRENIYKTIALDKPELLLILGAGDIDQIVKPIKNLYA